MNNLRALHYFTFFNCFRPHWPIAVIYFQEITASYASAMAIYSIVFLSQALLEVPAGIFSDLIGRRRTMIWGALCATGYITCYAVGLNFWVLAVGALLEASARALFSGTDSALLFESLPEHDKGRQFQHYLGRINSMAQLALGISAALCAVLSLHSLKLVLWVSVFPQFLSLISVLFLTDKSRGEEHSQTLAHVVIESFAQFKTNGKLRLLALAETLEFGFGEALFYFQAAFFNLFIPTWALGLARCLNHFAGFTGFWFAGRAIGYFGARNTLIRGTSLVFLIKFSAVLFASTLSPFIMAITNLFYGPCTAARSTLLQLEFSDRQRATMNSMVSLTGSILFALFAVVSTFLGYIADVASPGLAMLFGISSSLVVVVLYQRIYRVHA